MSTKAASRALRDDTASASLQLTGRDGLADPVKVILVFLSFTSDGRSLAMREFEMMPSSNTLFAANGTEYAAALPVVEIEPMME